MTAGYSQHVSVPMTDCWGSRLHQSLLYRHARHHSGMHMARGDALLRDPAGAVVPSPHAEELALLQTRSQGGAASEPHTLGTASAGRHLCSNHGPPNLPETTPRRVLGVGIGSKTLGDDQGGGTTMRSPARDDRMPPRRFDAARVELRCRVNTAHVRQLILEHATIYTDGWASWAEDGHVYTGYVQAGPCCDPPEVSAL
jgi:hypothetical protein